MAYSIGQIVTMNLDGTNRDYRILKLNGNIAEVLCMSTVIKNTFGGSNTYAGSSLDTYLNTTWYSTLTATAKAAIVSKTFNQDSWYAGTDGSPTYSGHSGEIVPGATEYSISKGSSTYGAQITRNVYALSVQDVIDYVTNTDVGDGLLENYNIWKMFWNTTTQPSIKGYPWLRSASATAASSVWSVHYLRGYVYNAYVGGTYDVRPAFTIDLSKIFPDITLDLSTIGLPAGTHSIQMKLSDDGVTKADSELSNAVTFVVPEPLPQLETPTISLSGDTLSIEEVENAEVYDLYDGDTKVTTITPVRGYDVHIDGTDVGIGGSCQDVWIKFDNAPTSSVDWDFRAYTTEYGGMGQEGHYESEYKGSYPYSGGTVSGVTKMFVWYEVAGDIQGRTDFLTVNGVVVISDGSSGRAYTNAFEYTFTQNSSVYIRKGGECFAEGTQILMADGSTKNIENLLTDDLIIAYDTETQKEVISKVLQPIKHENKQLYRVTFSDGTILQMTDGHPILTSNNVFKNISGTKGYDKLTTEDIIVKRNGTEISLVSVEKVDGLSTVYNASIDKYHTYCVEDIYAHNAPS